MSASGSGKHHEDNSGLGLTCLLSPKFHSHHHMETEIRLKNLRSSDGPSDHWAWSLCSSVSPGAQNGCFQDFSPFQLLLLLPTFLLALPIQFQCPTFPGQRQEEHMLVSHCPSCFPIGASLSPGPTHPGRSNSHERQ